MMGEDGYECQCENSCSWKHRIKFGEILCRKKCDRYKSIKMNNVGSVHTHDSYIFCKYKIEENKENNCCDDSLYESANQENWSDNQPADEALSQFAFQTGPQIFACKE